MIKKPIIIFLITTISLTFLFFVFPINVFDGKIVYESSSKELTINAPLSLSYFIGLGYEESDMVGVKTFYLTFKGTIMALIIIVALPALLAVRVYFKKELKSSKKF